MSAAINLYAEFLLNIRQVTVYATLQNDCHGDNKAYVFSDRKSLRITHDGKSATITFPSGISGKATVEFPLSRSNVVSLRLEIVEDDKPSHGVGMEVANETPWPASSLTSQSQIACRKCSSMVVEKAERIWKDLPRDDWAEMMDLWHCHKPSHIASSAPENGLKGYSAANKPRAQAGVGLVDTCHVLLTKEDCKGLEVCHTVLLL